MKHAQLIHRIVAFFPLIRREFLVAALLTAGITNNSPVSAADKTYLDILNEEAESTGIVANTGKSASKPSNSRIKPAPSPRPKPVNKHLIKSAPDEQPTFIMQVNSKLNGGTKPQKTDNEDLYLEQLENEVQKTTVPAIKRHRSQNYPRGKPNPGTTGNAAQSRPSRSDSPAYETDLASKQKELVKFTEAQRKEMEIALEMKIPGVYHLYKQLNLSEKRVVLQKYMENKKISAVGKSIIKLFSGD